MFWGVAVGAGGLVPVALIATGAAFAVPLVGVLAALLAIAGGVAWERIWVEAGQSVPLS